MIQMEDIKLMSRTLVESHNSRGFGLCRLTTKGPVPVGVLINISLEPAVVEGKTLRAKADIRKFLWDMSVKRGPSLRRKDRTWIWSNYMAAENKSVVGLATMVRRDVAERLLTRNNEYQWIEVQP